MTSTEISDQHWEALAEVPGASREYKPLTEDCELAVRRQPRSRKGDVIYRMVKVTSYVGIIAAHPERRYYDGEGGWVIPVRPPEGKEEHVRALRAAINSVAEESRHLAELGPDDERDRMQHEQLRTKRQELLDSLREAVA